MGEGLVGPFLKGADSLYLALGVGMFAYRRLRPAPPASEAK